MWRMTLMAAVLVALAACGGDDSETVSPVATHEETTTTTVAPDVAFIDEITLRLDFGDDDGPETFLDLGGDLCTQLSEMPAEVAADDAANDTPETDAAIGEVMQSAALSAVYDAFDPRIAEVLLEETGEHLCPEHAETISAFLEAREG